MENTINTQGLYIYGIIPNCHDAEQFQKLKSLGVFNIAYQKVSAIVSLKSVTDYRQLSTEQLAKLLVDHQMTIENLMKIGFRTVIPIRLGTFARDNSDVVKILTKGYDLIMQIIEKTTNLIEIDLISTWADFSGIMAEIAVHPEVFLMKEKIEHSPTGVRQTDQLSIGYLVKKILDEKKADFAAKIVKTLNPFCQMIKQHEVLNDKMVSNTAFLINQSQLPLLEKALDLLDEILNGQLNFRMVGPLPCYSFYTLEVMELQQNELESARKELGLNTYTSEKNIKQAYLSKAKLFHPDRNTGSDTTESFNRINKAYQTMVDYVNVVQPESHEKEFSLANEALTDNSLLLKIKD